MTLSVGKEDVTMREIKFRAWDIPRKVMVEGLPMIAVIHNAGKSQGHTLYQIDDYHGNFYIMQYTGLKDKNGKEIYEGDIIGYPNPKLKRVVEFGNDVGIEVDEYTQRISGFYLRDLETPALYPLTTDNIEVIGNIYENKELL